MRGIDETPTKTTGLDRWRTGDPCLRTVSAVSYTHLDVYKRQELGRLTLLSYPMIALPSMLIMAAALYYLVRTIHTLAGLKLTDALKH